MRKITLQQECIQKLISNSNLSWQKFQLRINDRSYIIPIEEAKIIIDEIRYKKSKSFTIDIKDNYTYVILRQYLQTGYFEGEVSDTSIEDLFNIGVKLNWERFRGPLLEIIDELEITEDNFIQFLDYYTKSKDCLPQINEIIDFIIKNFHRLPNEKLLLIDNFDIYEQILKDRDLKVKSVDQLALFLKALIKKSKEYIRLMDEINWIKCPENVRIDVFDAIRELFSDNEDFVNSLNCYSSNILELSHNIVMETAITQETNILPEIPNYSMHILLGISMIFNLILCVTVYLLYLRTINDDSIRLEIMKAVAPTKENFFSFYQNIALFASHGFERGLQFAVDYLQTLRNENGQDLLHYAATLNRSDICIILDKHNFGLDSSDNIVNVFLNAGNRKGIEYFGSKYRELLNKTEKIGSHEDRNYIESLKIKFNMVPNNSKNL